MPTVPSKTPSSTNQPGLDKKRGKKRRRDWEEEEDKARSGEEKNRVSVVRSEGGLGTSGGVSVRVSCAALCSAIASSMAPLSSPCACSDTENSHAATPGRCGGSGGGGGGDNRPTFDTSPCDNGRLLVSHGNRARLVLSRTGDASFRLLISFLRHQDSRIVLSEPDGGGGTGGGTNQRQGFTCTCRPPVSGGRTFTLVASQVVPDGISW